MNEQDKLEQKIVDAVNKEHGFGIESPDHCAVYANLSIIEVFEDYLDNNIVEKANLVKLLDEKKVKEWMEQEHYEVEIDHQKHTVHYA